MNNSNIDIYDPENLKKSMVLVLQLALRIGAYETVIKEAIDLLKKDGSNTKKKARELLQEALENDKRS